MEEHRSQPIDVFGVGSASHSGAGTFGGTPMSRELCTEAGERLAVGIGGLE